ncbi:MAG TPA: hypothetical protein VGC60_18995 [Pyrinomonadaceae bacterium]
MSKFAAPVWPLGKNDSVVQRRGTGASSQTEPGLGMSPMYPITLVWYSPQTRQREALKRVATDIILLSVSSFFNSSGAGDNA